jgi:hypothetical protein
MRNATSGSVNQPAKNGRARKAGGHSVGRRTFLGHLGGAAATSLALGGAAVPLAPRPVEAAAGPAAAARRRQQAFQVRVDAARLARSRPLPKHPDNGDEARYPDRVGSYSKGLPHNQLCDVDLAAYAALKAALASGDPAAFESIPMGLGRRLVNPQASLAFDLEGADSHHLAIPPAPALASAEAGGELVEVYWMAVARDIGYTDYATDPTIAEACADLSALSDFRGPKIGGRVTPGTIFRGFTPGDLVGPYLSQFLWLDIPMGALSVPQLMRTTVAGDDYMTGYGEWLAIQNGYTPGTNVFDPTPRYIRNLRDLAEWVHVDALYQAYHQACLILLGMGAPFDEGNPYGWSQTQVGFGTFGGPHILSLVTEVATRALKAVWYQKWQVHRRLRPEMMAGLVHQTLASMVSRPVHPDALGSSVLDRLYRAHGSLLLPMAFPEGSPTHPSYGAGHATVAGACVTILKAWFDESFVLPAPVVASPDGTALLPYSGPDLQVGGELNKLAANVAIGRNAAGVHYRTDCTESLRLGEAVAISVLEEQAATYNEDMVFSLTKFDGTPITI